jgi:phospholipid/cholesterol/gamma-HCH transport system ATP-binding protein
MTAPPIIRVTDLTIGHDKVVLQENATFDVFPGDIFAILGGSGSGKSTMLRYLIGLETPLRGDIHIAGLGRPNLEVGRPPFGVMFQSGALFGSMTVGENVALSLDQWTDLPRDAIQAVVLAKLRLVGLEGASDKFPAELSGGMKKRAGIARALALDPELLFLDEPTAGLDPIGASAFDQLILDLRGRLDLTVFLITHDLDTLYAICDRVAVLADRKVIAVGTIPELLALDHEWIQEYFRGPRGRAAETSVREGADA